ncbi:MAG TPA: DUF3152 domain-containing protein [Pseudonocardiaceae bacterium]
MADGEDRYRRGERRTTAEPLTASWHLDPEQLAAAPRTRHRRRRPGWRAYVLPALIIVTFLVVLNTAQPTGDGTRAAELAGTSTSTTPVVTEGSAVPVVPTTGTAVLPPGPAVPQVGAGTWHIVPGNGPVVGKGARVYRYQVAVEDGIDPAGYGGDDAFAAAVQATLSDPRSWIAAGKVRLQRVDADFPHPDFVISLTTPGTDHRPDLCGHLIGFEASCWQPHVHRVIINLARWVRGALAFDGDLGLYRQYAINHEVGHVFGNEHVGCVTNGGLAPVMMQQTFGVSDDYVHDLNRVDPTNADRVPRDGKVCRPNAWPYPQA